MSFPQNFCPSPWFHMRINNSGSYEPCRWMVKDGTSRVNFDLNIKQVSPLQYFQQHMSALRSDLLQGHGPNLCGDCHVMEQHGKPSGRQRQLLKAGILVDHFEKSLASAPMRKDFDHSLANNGTTDRTVSDWQIDLGNYCNGACVFCGPSSSSTLATEFHRLGLIDKLPPRAWCDDPELLDKFTQTLVDCDHVHYLHFIGGETLITPGFKKILKALVDRDLAKQVTVGFTTNLTVWSDSVIDLLAEFQQINLGMSVETLTKVNDYVRYPSEQSQTKNILDRWVQVGKQHGWLLQLRTTPSCLTVHDLPTVYDYAWEHRISVESCNFLDHPKFLRIGVLPQQQRDLAGENIKHWISTHQTATTDHIINTRDPNLAHQQITQDARSYLDYLLTATDESHRLPDLVKYLKLLESGRGNCVLDYVPQYENIFRSAGY